MTDEKPFKFRHASELAGLFVLLALAGLVAATVVAGRLQGWFEPMMTVRIRFGDEGALGLQPGAEVWILDTPAGFVREVRPDEEGRMVADLRVRGAFARYVRQDSVAVLKRKIAGVAGDVYVDITPGTGVEVSDEDPFIAFREDTQILDQIEETLDMLSASAAVVLEEVMNTVQEIGRIAAGINDPEGAIQKSLGHVETILAGLAEGEGTAGKLLRDPAMAEGMEATLGQVEGLLAEARGLAAQVGGILEDVKATTAQLPGMARSVDDKIDQVPVLLDQTHATLRDAEILLEGVQRHWLLRRYMPEPASATPLRASEVALPPPGERP